MAAAQAVTPRLGTLSAHWASAETIYRLADCLIDRDGRVWSIFPDRSHCLARIALRSHLPFLPRVASTLDLPAAVRLVMRGICSCAHHTRQDRETP
jgi:hypothetical protein